MMRTFTNEELAQLFENAKTLNAQNAPEYFADRLKMMMTLQFQLNQRVTPLSKEATDEQLTDRMTNWLQALTNEVEELRDCYPWKWWKKAKLPTIFRESAKEEAVDVLHFLLSVMLDLGMDADELFQLYLDKNAKNVQRQVDGY